MVRIGEVSGAPLLGRVRDLWVGLAGGAVSFPVEPGVVVAASPGSRLAPAGWVGIVRIGEAAVATAASARDAELLREVLVSLGVPAITDPVRLRGLLPVADVFGPAWLAYLDRDYFRAAGQAEAVDRLPPGHPDLLAMLEASPMPTRARAASPRSPRRCSSPTSTAGSSPRPAGGGGRMRSRTLAS
jgi:hypothetical protein